MIELGSNALPELTCDRLSSLPCPDFIALITYFIVEEVDGVFVQSKGQGLEKRDIVSHHFLIRKIKFVYNNGIDVIIGQQII